VRYLLVGWAIRPSNRSRRDKIDRKRRVGYYWLNGLYARVIGVGRIN
jgi:hypothetical protein